MYQVIARKYRPLVLRAGRPGARPHDPRERHRAGPHRARLHLLRPARHGQDDGRPHPGALPELREGPHRQPCGECASCREIAAGGSRGRHRDRRGLQSRHQRDARAARERPLPPGARPLQGLHHRRSPPDHQRSLQRAAEDARRAARVGGVRPLHHRIAQDPATIASRCQQFSFRSVDFDELVARMRVDLRAGRHRSRPEVLAVLAQAGEGSVRDSLSALDQAIACCGNTLEAAEVRELLGMFSLESLQRGHQALCRPIPAGCSRWCRNWSATAATCSTSAANCALLPQSAGGESGRAGTRG
jgi:DNA polymerase III subunit gamma/tau